jgi:hypothetical protein
MRRFVNRRNRFIAASLIEPLPVAREMLLKKRLPEFKYFVRAMSFPAFIKHC